jgi:hypothetical protein
MNREQWLMTATDLLRPWFERKAGVEIPADVKVSCSFPGGGSAMKRIGECWPRSRSKAGLNEIFVSPKLDDKTQVLAVLAHELVHAVDNCQHGHKREFGKIARAVGLVGRLTSTTAGPDLVAFIEAMELPQYPHQGVLLGKNAKSERSGARVKLTCKTEDMSWWVSKAGFQMLQSCPYCEENCHHG